MHAGHNWAENCTHICLLTTSNRLPLRDTNILSFDRKQNEIESSVRSLSRLYVRVCSIFSGRMALLLIPRDRGLSLHAREVKFLLLPLIGHVLYPVYLSSCDVNVQLSTFHQHFGGRPGGPGLFDFPFFVIFASRLSRLHARLPILVHLVASWTPQMFRMSSLRVLSRRVSPVMHLESSFPLFLVGVW